jgi:hypothetical protein
VTYLRFADRPRWRQTDVGVRERGRLRYILVALRPAALLIRLKGTRTVIELTYGTAYVRACLLQADQRRQAKRESRKR